MRKISIICIITTLLLFSTLHSVNSEDLNPPAPGLPHGFWGSVTNQKGVSIQDGTIIEAVVDNESYYTTVMNGLYGWNETYQDSNPPFFIEDVNFDNAGETIKFYVGGIDTTQTEIYVNGAETNLDLTIDDRSGSGSNGVGNGGTYPPEQEPPIAEADGPYFGGVNRSVFFDGSNSLDDGSIELYEWDFGDGEYGTGAEVQHAYNSSGNYTVILTVTDNDGLSANDTTMAYIYNDSDGDGWTDEEELRYSKDPDDANSYPEDYDNDYIPNVIDPDDDNDGLSDSDENSLGSDPLDENDVLIVIYENKTFYLVDNNSDGILDLYLSLIHI